jgi:CheY-like chemotaxis protein
VRALMDRQVTQMIRLVDDLLDVSRITQGKLEVRRERLGLAEVVDLAVETSHALIEARKHQLTVTLPPQPLSVMGDLIRLGQVVSNLLSNAAKYTPEGGHIGLTVEPQGALVHIRVRDGGIGIPADMLSRVFEMFTQVDRSLERAQGGLGIGLTLVRRLVEMHGGSVEAHSAGPGQGSEFLVRLPLAPEQSVPQEPREEDRASGKPAVVKHRILVADDNTDAADSLKLLLTMMGHEVRTANDGLAAVEEAMAFRPDLILLDIAMPKLNGYEAARRIREQSQDPGLLIVALTGWGQDSDRKQSQAAGIDLHLVKPVKPAVLETLLMGLDPVGQPSPGKNDPERH